MLKRSFEAEASQFKPSALPIIETQSGPYSALLRFERRGSITPGRSRDARQRLGVLFALDSTSIESEDFYTEVARVSKFRAIGAYRRSQKKGSEVFPTLYIYGIQAF